MSYQPSLEDTQPKAPIRLPPQPEPQLLPPEEPTSGGPGCLVWGCVGVIVLAVAVAVVLMAGMAGWSSGRRTAEVNATATTGALVQQQINLVPVDVSNGSFYNLQQRIEWLAAITPGVADLPAFQQTATAVYLTAQPTATLPPTATEAPLLLTEEADEAFEITPDSEDGGFDAPALLAEAEQDVTAGNFQAAYDILDILPAIDADFETARVRQLTAQALNGQARILFNANQPAQAIIWATRAEELGVLEGDLSFELFAAQNYLNAKAAIGLNYSQAITALYDVYNLGPGRYYEEARDLLIDQYIRYGDALVGDPNAGYCPAVTQYEQAAQIAGGGTAVSKRDNARSMCAQATPTGGAPTGDPSQVTPGAPPQNGQPAPVGQVG